MNRVLLIDNATEGMWPSPSVTFAEQTAGGVLELTGLPEGHTINIWLDPDPTLDPNNDPPAPSLAITQDGNYTVEQFTSLASDHRGSSGEGWPMKEQAPLTRLVFAPAAPPDGWPEAPAAPRYVLSRFPAGSEVGETLFDSEA